MGRLVVIGGLIGVWVCATLLRVTASSPLSEVQKLRAENYLLKRRLLTAECQSGIQQLETERTKLESELITAQGCDAGWNWETLTCAKPSVPEEDKKP